MSSLRTMVRRSCYAALPVAAMLIVPGFWLMPNHQYAREFTDATLWFQLGYASAFVGIALAVTALLVLVLVAEE